MLCLEDRLEGIRRKWFAMNKKVRNSILLSALSVMFLGFFATVPTIAQENRLNSTPNAVVEVEKQSLGKNIEIYTNDIYTLNNEIISLREYVDNFNKIPAGTYYYVAGTEGNSSTIERYKKIDGNFYLCDANGAVVNGASPVDVSSKQLVEYTVSAAGNLSAGSAGFVDKSMILGDGSDNAAYEEQGYRAGYVQGVAEGSSNNATNATISYVYHQHIDSCYGTCSVVTSYPDTSMGYYGKCPSATCPNSWGWHNVHSGNTIIWSCGTRKSGASYVFCSTCGNSWFPGVDMSHSCQTILCGKTEDTVESATIIF